MSAIRRARARDRALHAAAARRGLSLTEVAGLLGIGKSTLWFIAGGRETSFEHAARIAGALGTPIESLFEINETQVTEVLSRPVKRVFLVIRGDRLEPLLAKLRAKELGVLTPLARATGISRSNLSRVLRGMSTSRWHAELIAAAFGRSVDDLFHMVDAAAKES